MQVLSLAIVNLSWSMERRMAVDFARTQWLKTNRNYKALIEFEPTRGHTVLLLTPTLTLTLNVTFDLSILKPCIAYTSP